MGDRGIRLCTVSPVANKQVQIENSGRSPVAAGFNNWFI